jgi:hypothetical protein
MSTFAHISNNIVVNVIIADTKEIAETITGETCIEYTEDSPVGIGWVYDGKTITPPVEKTNE